MSPTRTESERLADAERQLARMRVLIERVAIDCAPSILLTIGAACGIAAYMACCYFIWKDAQHHEP